jgi:hypothetical protein
MQTAKERLEFAIRLTQMDLDRLRPGDWLNLRDDLEAFLGKLLLEWLVSQEDPAAPLAAIGNIVGTPTEAPYPEEYGVDDFRVLQQETKRLLTHMLDQREGAGVSSSQARIPVCFNLLNFGYVPSLAGRNMLEASGTTRNTFLVVLYFLLSREPTDRILRCPECQTIFYRIRKQQYCSRPCVHRAAVRKWRRTETGQRYERQRSRSRYEARVKRTHGHRVKINRRAQSGE